MRILVLGILLTAWPFVPSIAQDTGTKQSAPAKADVSSNVVHALSQLTGQLFYHPDRRAYTDPDSLEISWENVEFESADGTRLHGWFLKSSGKPKGTVVHCHGNAGNVSAHIDLVAWLTEYDYNVLMFDYRGFGKSAGRVSRAGVQADAAAAVTYARGREDVDPNAIVLMGHSIGGTIALRGVGDGSIQGVKGVVSEGGFSSYRRIAGDMDGGTGLAAMLVNDALSPLPVVNQIAPVPLLLVHADTDEMIPLHHARALHEAAAEPKELWVVKNGRHMDTFVDDDESTRRRLVRFFEECVDSSKDASHGG